MDIDARRQGLGGSDLGAVLGLSQWRTPFQVWLEKTGRETPQVDTLPTRFGTYVEEFVAQEYTRATGLQVRRHNATLRHRIAPVIGHVDRLVLPPGQKLAAFRGQIRTDMGLECKTASAFQAGDLDLWGESGTDQIPESYLIQCAAYMALTECGLWDLAVLFGNSDFRVYHIARDLDLEYMLLTRASEWWERHIVGDIPPDPQSEIEARQRWAVARPGRVVELDAWQASGLERLADIRAQQAELEKEEKALRDTLIPAMEDGEIITHDGIELATYRANRPSRKTDWQGIATALKAGPELIESYTRETPGARVLRLKARK